MANMSALQQLKRLSPGKRGREYLSGGYQRILSPLMGNALQVLTQHQGDLNQEFGDKVYDEMMRDPTVNACISILKALILSEPLRVVSKVQNKDAEGYEEAAKVAKWVEDQIAGMDRSVELALWESLEALQYGSSFVEIVLSPETDDAGAPTYRLKDLKTRNRSFYGLLVDRFYNVLGAVNREFGGAAGAIYTGSQKPDPERMIPREKFILITIDGKYNDPRGNPPLRCVWNPYYLKSQTWTPYLKFLVQFGSPSLVGYTPEEGGGEIEQVDADGNPILEDDGTPAIITDEEDMLDTLLGFGSGTVAVLRGGSKLDIIQSTGEGQAFAAAVDLFDRQIATGILKTARTLFEAKHSSKADSESAADITDVYIAHLQEVISGALERDLVKNIVTIQFGEETARKYCPGVTLKSIPKQDFAKAAGAVAQLWAGKFIHTSQVEEIDNLLGLPKRDIQAFLDEIEEEAEMRRIDQTERMKLLNPGAGTNPPKAEKKNEDT